MILVYKLISLVYICCFEHLEHTDNYDYFVYHKG